MQSYDTLFEQRGSSYDQAMRRFPDAREQEFQQVIRAARPQAGQVVLDVPAGGGYLGRYLPPGCQWRPHEPCASFLQQHGSASPSSGVPLLPLPWADASADVAVSLAGVHHLSDKLPLFRELYRVVKPGGRLVVSDVAEGSAEASFLDHYIGSCNSTGHEGRFLNADTLMQLGQAGWQVGSAEDVAFHWQFQTEAQMAQFCHLLFDVQTANLADTQQAIRDRLGIDPLETGCGMRWSLFTITASRA